MGLGGIGAAAAYAGTQRQYCVGSSDGKVTIYRGINAELPGIDLNEPYEVSDVELDRLTRIDQESVRDGINVDSLEDARSAVENLAAQQQECAEPGDEDADPDLPECD